MDLVYIRTDKNGTKIYHDWTCQRCGGAGQSEAWALTGRTCYDCGGSGRRHKPLIVKKYTPEYAALLKEKREKKLAEKRAKAKAEGYLPALKRLGFGADGVAYVYTGNTYEIKDDLKRGGAKFTFALHWVSPTPIENFPCVEIHAAEVVEFFEGVDCYDLSNPKCEAWREAHGLTW